MKMKVRAILFRYAFVFNIPLILAFSQREKGKNFSAAC